MKRKYIKPTTEVFASIEEPIMDISGGVNNSGQSDDGGVGAHGTDFMEDESLSGILLDPFTENLELPAELIHAIARMDSHLVDEA